MSPSFLGLPVELRLRIYEDFLNEHTHVRRNRQPSNTHFRLLHVCKQITDEATCLRQYISLLHENQIRTLLSNANGFSLSCIRSVDVANDGRVIRLRDKPLQNFPVSVAHEALYRMKNMTSVRVFNTTRGTPVGPLVTGAGLSLQFELALFPVGPPRNLQSYETFLGVGPQNTLFQSVQPTSIQRLRLSGACRFSQSVSLVSLEHLTVDGAQGSYMERHLAQDISLSRLKSFAHAQRDAMGFEFTEALLVAIVAQSSTTLTRLVILDGRKLETTALGAALRQLQVLDYLAVVLVSREFEHNFAQDIASTISTLKLWDPLYT
ncbi:hypothetical protein CYLTODRAFT_449085 [Cylindrobasidium torrendii FP15055 ss-10]|uniref:F-box domain-containing protein n=1 Tax=Cylindrobasidium torrendii FP15055 ss-10 TaxID=1314674 RepID=A0A0D7BRU4_9AGAR|nr:hypothetical protein CYLTODRAFT_449085 [Cylindrobasidium torrendii FP15055 ss-10]